MLALAGVLTLVGFVLIFVPGPAFVFLGLAAALLAEESLAVARALDWTEVKIRRAVRRIRGPGIGEPGGHDGER